MERRTFLKLAGLGLLGAIGATWWYWGDSEPTQAELPTLL